MREQYMRTGAPLTAMIAAGADVPVQERASCWCTRSHRGVRLRKCRHSTSRSSASRTRTFSPSLLLPTSAISSMSARFRHMVRICSEQSEVAADVAQRVESWRSGLVRSASRHQPSNASTSTRRSLPSSAPSGGTRRSAQDPWSCGIALTRLQESGPPQMAAPAGKTTAGAVGGRPDAKNDQVDKGCCGGCVII